MMSAASYAKRHVWVADFEADAAHLVVKPWERMVTQQGLVDWFRFLPVGIRPRGNFGDDSCSQGLARRIQCKQR